MHEEEVDVAGVVDKEGLVAGGHHVAGLLVGAKTNLLRIVRIHRCPRRSDVRDGQKSSSSMSLFVCHHELQYWPNIPMA